MSETITIRRDPETGLIETVCDGIGSHMEAIMMCATAIHALHGQHDHEVSIRDAG